MGFVLLFTKESTPGAVLDALEVSTHVLHVASPHASSLSEHGHVDALLLDARTELSATRSLAAALKAVAPRTPLIAVATESQLVAITPDWGLTDVLLTTSSIAECEARLRWAMARTPTPMAASEDQGHTGPRSVGKHLTIDDPSYAARVNGILLDLTYKEFELLRFLATHPGRVFSRATLLQEVWGHDYFGGTRTVDVHIRRLRAKLGHDHDMLIGTVRNVGYRFEPDGFAADTDGAPGDEPLL